MVLSLVWREDGCGSGCLCVFVKWDEEVVKNVLLRLEAATVCWMIFESAFKVPVKAYFRVEGEHARVICAARTL